MIDRFLGQYAFLSNFFPCRVEFAGLTFRSSEAAYQAMKSPYPEVRAQFAGLSAKEAKRAGRSIEARSDWEAVKAQIMRDIVHAKFDQHRDLAALLVQTGDETLVEGNCWHDNTYGDCRCPECADTPGQNILGCILMMERLYWQGIAV